MSHWQGESTFHWSHRQSKILTISLIYSHFYSIGGWREGRGAHTLWSLHEWLSIELSLFTIEINFTVRMSPKLLVLYITILHNLIYPIPLHQNGISFRPYTTCHSLSTQITFWQLLPRANFHPSDLKPHFMRAKGGGWMGAGVLSPQCFCQTGKSRLWNYPELQFFVESTPKSLKKGFGPTDPRAVLNVSICLVISFHLRGKGGSMEWSHNKETA